MRVAEFVRTGHIEWFAILAERKCFRRQGDVTENRFSLGEAFARRKTERTRVGNYVVQQFARKGCINVDERLVSFDAVIRSANFCGALIAKNASLTPRHHTSTRKKLAPTSPDGKVRANATQPMPSAKSRSATTQALIGERAVSLI